MLNWQSCVVICLTTNNFVSLVVFKISNKLYIISIKFWQNYGYLIKTEYVKINFFMIFDIIIMRDSNKYNMEGERIGLVWKARKLCLFYKKSLYFLFWMANLYLISVTIHCLVNQWNINTYWRLKIFFLPILLQNYIKIPFCVT